jgi:hypothetical protein
MSKPHFNGATYVPRHDWRRLTKQHDRVRDCALTWQGNDGPWFTLEEISTATGYPAASVSAQLRHLRKPRFGGYTVDKRPRGDRSRGLYEYKVTP